MTKYLRLIVAAAAVATAFTGAGAHADCVEPKPGVKVVDAAGPWGPIIVNLPGVDTNPGHCLTTVYAVVPGSG